MNKFLTTEWAKAALEGSAKAENFSKLKLSEITTDTRSLKKGALFVALAGENADGHKFVDSAVERGAAALLVRSDFKTDFDGPIFRTEDTLLAYRLLARAWRREFDIPLVAVAGSAGKTTTKELLAALLRGKFKNVHQTKFSQNGFQGIPTTLLALNESHEAAVIEVGIDEPNTMERHLDIVQPIGGLLSSIGPEHLEKLIDVETVAREEGKLFSYLETHAGFACVNYDDPLIVKQSLALKNARTLCYALTNVLPAAVHGLKGRYADDTMYVSGLGRQEEKFSVPMEGRHNALNLLGAVAMAKMLGLSADEMRAGLRTFTPPPGRSETYIWRGDVKVYADTYNANPVSVGAALEMLSSQPCRGATWVVLGDMLELGALEEKLHRGLAEPIQKAGVQNVLLTGPRMQKLVEELRERRFAGRIEHHECAEALADRLSELVKPGDRILLKGSRGMKMERVWERLRSL